jgi:gamma-glutamylcysteine synthetase
MAEAAAATAAQLLIALRATVGAAAIRLAAEAEVTLAVAEAVIPAVEVGVAIRAVEEADTLEAITNKLVQT